GRPVAEMDAAISRREQEQLALEKKPEVRYYEDIDASAHGDADVRGRACTAARWHRDIKL
ncbi:MAG: hypothetical protein Q7R57_04405, partial [Dehalococcoidales bacterium]|nr:hypothetical protein [Dehalococcoidales bacterium]